MLLAILRYTTDGLSFNMKFLNVELEKSGQKLKNHGSAVIVVIVVAGCTSTANAIEIDAKS